MSVHVRHAVWLCAIAGLAANGCFDDGTVGATQTDVSQDVATPDGLLVDSSADDLAGDGSPQASGGGDSATDIQACPGGSGCTCKENKDCDLGFCIAVPAGGQVCARNCATSCPDGFKCAPVTAGGDTINICVPRWGHLCTPCTKNAECKPLGIATFLCMDRGVEGAYCSVGCDTLDDCPKGHTCQPAKGIDGGTSKLCVPDGACTCSLAAIANGASTLCSATVALPDGDQATCKGVRQCAADGLTACKTVAVGNEVCDGIDNDCDGQTDEAACDDSNPCTDDPCDPTLGAAGKEGCSHMTKSDTPCNADDNVCTEGDKCVAGKCAAGLAKACASTNPCTAAACDAKKGCVLTNDDGKACSDDNSCTVGDACTAGSCIPGKPKVCDSGSPCKTAACDATTGTCATKPVADGTACSDGTVCTEADACGGGECAGKPKLCDDLNPCTSDVCDPVTGCKSTAVGGPCSDDNACTELDTCKDAKCVGLAKEVSVACDDKNACTIDACDVKVGCLPVPATGTACDDGQACTLGDNCKGGACNSGADQCPCKVDADCAPLEDGDLCNGTLVCQTQPDGKRACKVNAVTVVQCPAGADTACETNTCAPKSGKCGPVSFKDGKACDADGSVCTVGDGCKGGACLPGAATACDDGNPCTKDACDAAKGCGFAAADGQCDDGSQCTIGDGCKGGVCVPGAVTACDDDNPCTLDTCAAAKGCQHAPADGKCTDGDACTVGDACASGSCAAGAPAACKDDNSCTEDVCDPAKGCTFGPLDQAACDDGSPCTQDDVCQGGKCAAGTPVDCDDGNVCTKDTCGAPAGCAHLPQAATCTDGSVCTVADTCAGGTCKAGAPKVCDDGVACSEDSCHPVGNCQHKANDGACAAQTCKLATCTDKGCKYEPDPACCGDVKCGPNDLCLLYGDKPTCVAKCSGANDCPGSCCWMSNNAGKHCLPKDYAGYCCGAGVEYWGSSSDWYACGPGGKGSCHGYDNKSVCTPKCTGSSECAGSCCWKNPPSGISHCLPSSNAGYCCGTGNDYWGKASDWYACGKDGKSTCILDWDGKTEVCTPKCSNGNDCGTGSCCIMKGNPPFCEVPNKGACCNGTAKEWWGTKDDPWACGPAGKGQCINWGSDVIACAPLCGASTDCGVTKCCIPLQGGAKACAPQEVAASYCPAGDSCGNGSCGSSENCASCPADCKCINNTQCNASTGKCESPAGFCGDGIPGGGETCANCPSDFPCTQGKSCINGTCACASNFCQAKGAGSGSYCDGSNAVQCGTDGACNVVAGAQVCQGGCNNGKCDSGVTCLSNFCQTNNYGSGSYCSGSTRISCGTDSNGCKAKTGSQDCADGCKDGQCIQCQANFCQSNGYGFGTYCNGNSAVTCTTNGKCKEVVATKACASGYICKDGVCAKNCTATGYWSPTAVYKVMAAKPTPPASEGSLNIIGKLYESGSAGVVYLKICKVGSAFVNDVDVTFTPIGNGVPFNLKAKTTSVDSEGNYCTDAFKITVSGYKLGDTLDGSVRIVSPGSTSWKGMGLCPGKWSSTCGQLSSPYACGYCFYAPSIGKLAATCKWP